MPSEPRARSGCCAKSCLLLVILGVLFVGVVVGAGYWALNKGIAALTSDKPVAIKIEQPTDAQFNAAATKFNDLSNALTIGEAQTVEFTAADLNALIARHPGYFFPRLKGQDPFQHF